MQKINDFLLGLDSYAEPINLKFKGRDSQPTMFGSFISVAAYAVTIYLSLSLTLQMVAFEKFVIKNYTVSKSQDLNFESGNTYSFEELKISLIFGFNING